MKMKNESIEYFNGYIDGMTKVIELLKHNQLNKYNELTKIIEDAIQEVGDDMENNSK